MSPVAAWLKDRVLFPARGGARAGVPIGDGTATKYPEPDRAQGCAPAFFLLLALSLSGLRPAWSWELFALVFFGLAVFFRKESFALPGGLWPWFFGWLLVSSLFSPEPFNALSQCSKYLVYAVFLSLTSKGSAASRRSWMHALWGAALISAAVIFYQRFSGAEVCGIIGKNPNYSAALIAGAFASAWVFMFSEKERSRKALYGLLSAVFISGIIAANSRGALAASMLAAAAYLIISNRRRALLYLAAALALAAAIVPADWLSVLFKSEDPRAYARIWIWKSALEAALARPFFGFGPGLFERAFELFKFPYFNGISYYGHSTLHAHSEVLNLAAEAGLPAAALFVGAVFYSVKEKSRDAFESAMKFCALALFVQGAFDMIFYSGAVSLLFFGSLGFAAPPLRPQSSCGAGAAQSRPILPALGVLCILGLAPRIAFERDYNLAMRQDTAQNAPALRRALFFAPYNKELLLRAARGRLLASGNYAYAAAFVENAAVFCPKDPRFPYLSAQAVISGASAGAAYAGLEKALDIEPGFLAARYALARLLYSDGKLKEAAVQAAIIEKLAAAYQRQLLPGAAYDMLLVSPGNLGSQFGGLTVQRLKKHGEKITLNREP